MKFNFQKAAFLAACVGLWASCSKDDAPVIPVVPPSDGAALTLNGGGGGASAVNSVFIDFSTNKADTARRNSWDLAFYNGSEFRVTLNNTNGGSAVMVNKTDINTVTAADLDVNSVNLTPLLGDAKGFALIDDVQTGAITGTVIGEVSATEANNKVYVVNPEGGTHASVFSEANLYKVRILRSGTTGYTLQYAKLSETTFKTIAITKNPEYNFTNVKLSTAAQVIAQPKKADWDITWTWSIYYGGTGAGLYPYGYSDIVFINHLAGVTAAEVLTSTVTYDAYVAANIATTTFTATWDVIGSKWRSTQPATGAKTDRFYVIKDAGGNVYKLKFISMGAGDAGVRGAPQLEFKLVK